ncbi:hypothetical protein CC79DRAFT_1360202 [Sarocladium strictum]
MSLSNLAHLPKLPEIASHLTLHSSTPLSVVLLLAIPAEAIMESQDRPIPKPGTPIEVPPDHSQDGRIERLVADFNQAAKQVDAKDVNDSQKIDWLLSKLELKQETKDGLFGLLQEQTANEDPESALAEWKLIVLASWSDLTGPAKEREQE